MSIVQRACDYRHSDTAPKILCRSDLFGLGRIGPIPGSMERKLPCRAPSPDLVPCRITGEHFRPGMTWEDDNDMLPSMHEFVQKEALLPVGEAPPHAFPFCTMMTRL